MRMISFESSIGHDVRFVCDSRNTRNGFAHDATLFINDCRVSDGHCYYLNRTWERWNYESACLCAVSNAIDSLKARLKSDYKAANGLSRIAGKHKDALGAVIAADDRIALLTDIKSILSTRLF